MFKFYIKLFLTTWFGWLIIFTVSSLLAMLVSLFGFIWEFNNPVMGWFWLKLGCSTTVVFIMCMFILGGLKALDDEKEKEFKNKSE